MRSSIIVLAVVFLLAAVGCSLIGTGLSLEPEKVAIGIGDESTPEPTIGQWLWENLVPAEIREALLRRLEPPADIAPEPCPDVFIPAPKPAAYRFEMIDPREACKGCTIIVSGVVGSIEVRLREQELDGSWRSVTYGADKPIEEMLDAFVIKLSSGKLYIALWYWGEPSGVVPDNGYISLDDYLALDPPATEPTTTPTPAPTGDGPFIWVTNAGGLGLFLTARVDENKMASVFSLREYTSDVTLLVDDWFVTSTVYEFRGAEMRDDGYVYIRYGTSAQGVDITIRHQPWFR